MYRHFFFVVCSTWVCLTDWLKMSVFLTVEVALVCFSCSAKALRSSVEVVHVMKEIEKWGWCTKRIADVSQCLFTQSCKYRRYITPIRASLRNSLCVSQTIRDLSKPAYAEIWVVVVSENTELAVDCVAVVSVFCTGSTLLFVVKFVGFLYWQCQTDLC